MTRRMTVADLGKAGLAIVVLGAACATQDTEPEDPALSPSTSAFTPATTEPAPTQSSTTRPLVGTEFHRVNLGFVSAYILYRGGEAALVDTGVAGSSDAIGLALKEVGLTWGSVGHVIITHKHPDHQGSVGEVHTLASDAALYAGAADIPAITTASTISPVGDGDRVFDLDIIASPGHTAGHISVLDKLSRVLVAGDALNGKDGGVGGANPSFSEDMTIANATVTKLAGFDFEVALFGHGEPLTHDASTEVAALAATLGQAG